MIISRSFAEQMEQKQNWNWPRRKHFSKILNKMKRPQNINIYCVEKETDAPQSYTNRTITVSLCFTTEVNPEKKWKWKWQWSCAMCCFRLKNSTSSSSELHSFNYKYIFCWIVWSMAGDKDTCDFSCTCAHCTETNVAIFLIFIGHFISVYVQEITK